MGLGWIHEAISALKHMVAALGMPFSLPRLDTGNTFPAFWMQEKVSLMVQFPKRNDLAVQNTSCEG